MPIELPLLSGELNIFGTSALYLQPLKMELKLVLQILGGIPENVMERVFDPFLTTKEVDRGSGRGLAIARNIVHEKHNGELSFSSEDGIGNTFTLKLPTGG